MRLIRSLALLLVMTSPAWGAAQQKINCATGTACVTGGPVNTKTGDSLSTAGAKINANADNVDGQLSTLTTNVSGLTSLLNGQQFLAPGSFTSAQVLANHPASSTAGGVLTSDFGLLLSDGTRWSAPNPPIPPGAALLGYTHNAYTIFPTMADVALTNVLSRLYSGATIFANASPSSGSYSIASNGQLQISYPNGGPSANASALTTERNVNSQPVQGNLGYLPFLLGSRGFCVEEAVTLSINDPDNWFAFYVEPQEHNTLTNDHLSSDPTSYERWLELDINENGHGTDQSGTFRGAAITWEGRFNSPLTFTGSPTGTSGTLNAVWLGSTRTDWTIKFSDAQTHTATLTNNSTAVTWSGSITGTPTASATVSFARSVISNVQTASLDYTTEHIFTGCLDPVGQTWAIWQDGALQSTLTIPTTNAVVYNWHYFPLTIMQSRNTSSGNVGFTATIRYLSAWTP